VNRDVTFDHKQTNNTEGLSSFPLLSFSPIPEDKCDFACGLCEVTRGNVSVCSQCND